jgi:hypothetical protein
MSEPHFKITRRTALLTLGGLLVPAAGVVTLGVSCKPGNKGSITSTSSSDAPPKNYFEDVTAQSNVNFTFHNGETEPGYPNYMGILESLGGGVTLIDYDHSGLLSIFVVGGGYYTENPDPKGWIEIKDAKGNTIKDAKGKPKLETKTKITGYPCKLYKNLGDFKFKDVTEEVGLDKIDFYTHGAAVGDYNKDGYPDLLVTGWGRVALFRNEDNGKGGRKFVEVTKDAKLDDKLWSTSACFMDLDGKGYPDIYVAHYVDWDVIKNSPKCGGYDPKHDRDVCPPKMFLPLPHTLYQNNCDGTFTDISESCGLRRDGICDDQGAMEIDFDGQPIAPQPPAKDRKKPMHGKGLAVMAVDTNNDGRPDIMVANDTVNDFFYVNNSTLKNISLKERGVQLGLATNGKGDATGSMGIGQADYDRSGFPSFYITTYEHESPCLHHHRGKLNGQGEPQYEYATEIAGLLAIGRDNVSWGTAFVDIENRGWPDIIVANGHVIRFPVRNTIPQLPIILHAEPGKPFRFTPRTDDGGEYFRQKHTSRGMAYGDLNNDGRIDLVISNVNEPVVILRNVYESGNHWLGIELKGDDHRDIIGSRVILESAQGKQTRFTHSGGSYASTSDPRLMFGLGKDDKIDKITVVWSHTGKEQVFKDLAVDHYWRITEGSDKAERAGD